MGREERKVGNTCRMHEAVAYIANVQLVDERRRALVLGALMRAVFTLSLDWNFSCHEVHH